MLEELLNRDWPWCGFAIGDLEPEMARLCEWRRYGDSVVLLFDGLSPRLLCTYGDVSGLRGLLREVREERVWANVHPDAEVVFREFYRPERCVRMRRMYLHAATEAAVGAEVKAEGEAAPLGPEDRAEIEGLLATGEWVLFLPERLADGHYFGVRRAGRLVAMAGTHLASARFNIAGLGSVFTHPSYRGQGLARICCRHVLASVGRAGITRVVLNVEEEKAGARRVYERLGFRTACTYLDGECVRV